MTDPAAVPRLVPAVDRAARLLAALEAGRPMGISELARCLRLNKGTVRDLLETLRVHGLLQRDETHKQYRLGPRLARLGMAALGQLDLPRVAHPFLVALANEVPGAVLLLVRDGERAMIVDKVDNGRVAVEVSATIGRRIPLAAGACGKVFLSHVNANEVGRYLAALPRPIADAAAYREALAACRRRGYATDDEEYLAGVRATAAPVCDARGRLAAVVLVVGLTGTLALGALPATGAATARAAAAISAALGGRC